MIYDRMTGGRLNPLTRLVSADYVPLGTMVRCHFFSLFFTRCVRVFAISYTRASGFNSQQRGETQDRSD